METSTSQSELTRPREVSGRTVFCPGCGYDLRGSAASRCSECGLLVDRAALERSAFPWAHRASLGRARAFLKTVWLVTADAQSLRHETAKAQSPRDGASFRRCVAFALSACFAAFVTTMILAGGITAMAVDRNEFLGPGGMPRWSQDVLVPWSAGIALSPALFAYSTLFAFYAAGVPRSILRTRGAPEDYRRTVEAISGYVVAPLVLLLPATAGLAGLFVLHEHRQWAQRSPLLPILEILVIGGCVFAFAAVAGTVYRTGQWRARTAHAGYPTGFGGMGELLIRWAIGFAAALGVVPWCVGFVRIVVDTFWG